MVINEINDGLQIHLESYASTDTGQIIDFVQRLCKLFENEYPSVRLRNKMIYAVNDYFDSCEYGEERYSACKHEFK